MKFKKFLKYILFVAIIISLGMLYGFTSKRNQFRKVAEPTVEFTEGENKFLTHTMVNKLLIQNKKTVVNLTKSVINLYELENKVLQNPYVEKAAVFLTIEGRLRATIKQRIPIARIITNSNYYYIDKQGISTPVSTNFSARVPLVLGINNDENIKELVPLINRVKNNNFLHKEIIGIQRTVEGEYVLSVRSGSYKVFFGKLTDMDVKFKKLKAFYNKAFEDKTINNYKTITLKYHNQVVCTKEI